MSDPICIGANQRPLVTFAVFAYNQEAFIEDAIKGALEQDYEPLQIILSDDASTDATFALMQKTVEGYSGPHKVVLRQSEINLGTAAHVYAVSQLAKGELVVVAAGDDISLPCRTRLSVDAWLTTDRAASVIHGKSIAIDATTGREVRRSGLRPGCDKTLLLDWYVKKKALPFLSPTCAYSKSVFDRFPPLIGGSVIEDGVLAQRCFLVGEVVPVDEYLIHQRVNYESSGTGFSINNPLRWNRHIRSRVISALNRMQDLSVVNGVEATSRWELERAYLQAAKLLSTFILPLSKPMSLSSRLWLVCRLALRYPSSSSVLGRWAFAMRFAGFTRFLRKR